MGTRLGAGEVLLGKVSSSEIMSTSFLVLGDQLSVDVLPRDVLAGTSRLVMIEVEALKRKNRHRTRTALYLSAMRHFARKAGERGIDIDYRRAPSFEEGLAAHVEQFAQIGRAHV